MHYRHPRIGFAFDMPDDWQLDDTSLSANDATVVLRLGDTRLQLRIRPSLGTAAARLGCMQRHLESARAAHIGPCPAPPFGRSRDIVALRYFIHGRQRRWLSISHDGYDYILSHNDDWQDVAGAVDRLSASFIFPPAARITRALPDRDPVRGLVPPSGLAGIDDRGSGRRAPAAANGWWVRFSGRLRRARMLRTEG
ncbi:hypothetical protein BOSP111201_17200 [Bordetella sputigena]